MKSIISPQSRRSSRELLASKYLISPDLRLPICLYIAPMLCITPIQLHIPYLAHNPSRRRPPLWRERLLHRRSRRMSNNKSNSFSLFLSSTQFLADRKFPLFLIFVLLFLNFILLFTILISLLNILKYIPMIRTNLVQHLSIIITQMPLLKLPLKYISILHYPPRHPHHHLHLTDIMTTIDKIYRFHVLVVQYLFQLLSDDVPRMGL